MNEKVVIIGRTNTGKSTLFNRLVGEKYALVHNMPGTTRDRKESAVRWKGKEFTLVDTGGWANDDLIFSSPVKKQMEQAVNSADLVLFLVDVKQGIHPQDMELARFLRAKNKKTMVVVNKVDSENDEIKSSDFYGLGFDSMICVSADHGRNIAELLESILAHVSGEGAVTPSSGEIPINIILVGKPNVGKSSLVNTLSKQERCIVHEAPGTTREALDVKITSGGREYVLIDTPGLHRKRQFKDDMEYLAALSASHAIKHADVAILVMDASQGIGETEAKITEMILDNKKACVLAMNKWDLVEDKETAVKIVKETLEDKLKFISWSKVIFVSAKTGQRSDRILSESRAAFAEYSKIVPAGELSATVREAERKKPLSRHGHVLRIRSVSQEGTCPPYFSFAVNETELLHFSYRRYIENNLRAAFGFNGTPIAMRFHKG